MKKRYWLVIFNCIVLWMPLVVKFFVSYDSIAYRDICDLWYILFVPLHLVSLGIFLFGIMKKELKFGERLLSGFLVVALLSIYAVFNFFVVLMGMPQVWIAP